MIATYLAPLAGPEGLGLLDDAALYTPPTGHDLVLTQDTLVENIHFPNGHYGADTAEKLLRVNLSDLATKGARPVGYLLSLSWPKSVDKDIWMKGFAAGLKAVQESFDIVLFGGDTTATYGPMVVSATLIGVVPHGEMVKRSGAQVGDDVWVTGTIGDAYLGLQLVTGQDLKVTPSGAALWAWENAYFRPEPRLLFRRTLRKLASACADVSDGLLADAAHIAKASGVGLELNLADVPVSEETIAWLDVTGEDGLITLITAGDDYELVFTTAPDNAATLHTVAEKEGLALTNIGKVIAGAGVVCKRSDGAKIDIKSVGYTHF